MKCPATPPAHPDSPHESPKAGNENNDQVVFERILVQPQSKKEALALNGHKISAGPSGATYEP